MQRYKILDLPDDMATQKLGQVLAKIISPPCTVLLYGEIGAGKTTLVRAILQAMGVCGPVKSPTFSIVESYALANVMAHHFDLYRISDAAELDYIGFRDYFNPYALCFIEWPERIANLISPAHLEIHLKHTPVGREALIKVLDPYILHAV